MTARETWKDYLEQRERQPLPSPMQLRRWACGLARELELMERTRAPLNPKT